ncbi:hypothetical protein DY000_02058042 [Brassica cretica]|uniref:Uncharacterized protein n=1 Tax=Brassica cretica TaxID=69181 RepID=A0ABQ7AME9_BRACR|nr:hypothetical protein DY000_02058042 [Brassica cretica]
MTRKKRQKNKPPVRIPTGSTKPITSDTPAKSKMPDSFSAVKQKDLSDSSLAGVAAQSTHSSVPDKTISSSDLVEKVETPNSKILATETPSVPSAQKQSNIPAENKNHASSDRTSSPPSTEQKNPAEIWKGKAPIKSLLPIVPQPNLEYRQVGIKARDNPIMPSQTNDTPHKQQIVTQPPTDTLVQQPGTGKVAHTTTVEH